MSRFIILSDQTEGEGGATDAHDVAYNTDSDTAITNVWDALDKLFYKANVITLSGGGVYEIGSTVHGAHLTWTYSKPVVSQSLNQGIGALDPEVRSYDWPDDITSNLTFALTANDGKNNATASTAITFSRKRYWGVSPALSLDNAGILALSQEFASGLSKTLAYDCSGGRYPYYCYPASFGPLSDVRVGGLAFSDYTQTLQSFTNASGHTEDYYVTRFNGIQTGANIQVVWA